MPPPRKIPGLEKTDNGLKQTSFSNMMLINQKNYSAEYLKHDEQVRIFRNLNEDSRAIKKRKLELESISKKNHPSSESGNGNVKLEDGEVDNDIENEEGILGQEKDGLPPLNLHYLRPTPDKILIIHVGSRYTRVGLSSDCTPKVVPTAIAHRINDNSFEPVLGESGLGLASPADALYPNRVSSSSTLFSASASDSNGSSSRNYPIFNEGGSNVLGENRVDLGSEFMYARKTVTKDFKERMKFYKRRVLPNSRDLVCTFNKRSSKPEIISENDEILKDEWTNIPENPPKYILGDAALKIPEDSNPRYHVKWPIMHGTINETPGEYDSIQEILGDLCLILQNVIENELNIPLNKLDKYSCVLIIPDLYEKAYVKYLLDILFKQLRISQVSIIQESIAASFAAGLSSVCVVDVGAQTTKISCVEEGMVNPDSRINLKIGGDDITVAFTKLLLASNFPYTGIDLRTCSDFILADNLKKSRVTFDDGSISVQSYDFLLRKHNKSTEKYTFRVYDEVMLAPLGLFYPELFEYSGKMKYTNTLIEPSKNIYDFLYDDPTSEAMMTVFHNDYCITQSSILQKYSEEQEGGNDNSNKNGKPANGKSSSVDNVGGKKNENGDIENNGNINNANSNTSSTFMSINHQRWKKLDRKACAVAALDHAIIESIQQTTHNDNVRTKKLYENLLVIGGGVALIPGFSTILEDRIGMWTTATLEESGLGDVSGLTNTLTNALTIMPSPRGIDPTILTWTGGCVFSKLTILNETWISSQDWDIFGTRCLQYKCLFVY